MFDYIDDDVAMITTDQLIEAKETARIAEDEYRSMLKEYACQQCPLSLGDVARVTGFAHTGKKMVVTRISPGDEPGSFGYRGPWVARGAVLKNDGTPGKHTGEVWASRYKGA